MLKPVAISIAASLAISFSAFAEDCGFLRLDQSTGDQQGSMVNVPRRDQGNWGICYAEAAAQMVDAYRFSRLGDSTFIPSSEIEAVLDLYPVSGQSDPYSTGGSICDAIDENRINGMQDRIASLECVVKDQTSVKSASVTALYAPAVAKEKARQDQIGDAVRKSDWQTYSDLSKNDSALSDLRAGLIAAGYEPTKIPGDATLSNLLKADVGEMIWALSLYSCALSLPRTAVQLPICVEASPIRDQDYIGLWNTRLEKQNPQPVGIGICGAVLTDGKSYGGYDRAKHSCAPDKTGDSITGHAVLLIGRRKNDSGKCQYLVRNSWGGVCKTSDLRFHPTGLSPSKPIGPQPAVSGTPGQDQIYSSDWECDHGDVWVDGEVLARSTRTVNWFDGE